MVVAESTAVRFGDGNADFQQAEWLAEKLEKKWRYDHSTEQWHHYDGVRWALDKTSQIVREVAELSALYLTPQKVLDRLYQRRLIPHPVTHVENEAQRKAIEKLQSLPPVQRALEALATFPDYSTDGSDWDNEPHLLGVANGIVDLRKNELLPQGELSLATTVTRNTKTRFKPVTSWAEAEAVAPRFVEVLKQWTSDYDWSPDMAMVAFLLDWFGASLFGEMPEQRFLLMTGSGRNGKGALRHAIMEALGPDYAAQPDGNVYSRSKFGPARSNEARADLMALRGIRVAFFSEPDRGQFNEEMLKAHTGGDMITARGLYQRIPQSWAPTHSINFLVNDAPSLDDVGPSMGSRVMVADFRHRFDGELEDKQLYPTLKGERDGILSILVWAASLWWSTHAAGGGLKLPERVALQSQAFMERNDPVAECLRDVFAEGPDLSCAGQAAYDTYKDWHSKSGRAEDAMSMVKFALELEKKGFQKFRSATFRGWKGLRPLGAMALAEKEGGEDDGDDD